MALLLLGRVWAGSAVDDPTLLYREAQTAFKKGDFEMARTLFKELDAGHPFYKKTKHYIALCAVKLDERDGGLSLYTAAASRAQEILDIRQTLLAHVGTAYREVAIDREEGKTEFAFSPEFLFPGEDMEFSRAGSGFLSTAKDFASTFRTVFVTVVCERSPATDDDKASRNERRAIALGGALFRHGGLPPQNILLRSRQGPTDLFRIGFQTTRPAPRPGDTDIQGVLVEMKSPLWDRGVGTPLSIDVSLIDPARVQKWTLRLLQMPHGRAVKEFSGGSELFVSLSWDGKNEAGRPVQPGEYQAILTATGFGGARWEDTVGFLVKEEHGPPSRPSARREAPPESGSRIWAEVIAFSYNRSEIAGPGVLDMKRLAATLKMFPAEGVIIEGFADRAEENARALVRARAEIVRETLIRGYGISKNRLTTRGKDPRRALEGESLQKVLVFFTASDVANE